MRSGNGDVPGIGKSWRVKGWVKRVIATILLVTNLLTNPVFFLPSVSDRTVMHGYSLFTLPDGTDGVVLAGSTVSFTPDFDKLYREATMTGDGFFRVHSRDKMFVLHCEGGLVIRTRAGTFQVRSVPGNQGKMRVLVGSESVEITDLSGRSLGYFGAAEEAIINLETKGITRKQYDEIFISDLNIRPILRFERMTLADAATKLEDHFNVDIQVDRAIRGYLIDATFAADITISETLEAIRLSNRDKKIVYKITSDGDGKIRRVTISR
jgi:ferric-dicitrate binding protein FerR (iron transport regulator)